MGRGAGEAAGLKERIKPGVAAVDKRWRNGETRCLVVQEKIAFLCCLLVFSRLKVRINNQ